MITPFFRPANNSWPEHAKASRGLPLLIVQRWFLQLSYALLRFVCREWPEKNETGKLSLANELQMVKLIGLFIKIKYQELSRMLVDTNK